MVYPSTSSRWCPTPEQLMILEEMYRAGLRTPKAAQIEQITAHLSLYGKIEGKNVFYWFQNHKARERQKLKRKLQSPKKHNPNHHHHLQQYYESLLPFAPQIMYCIPVGILPQGGVEVASPQMMTCSWKLDPILDQRREMDSKFMERTNNRDWVVVLDVGPGNKHLKTLELFPTAANGLKDECTTFIRNPSSTTTN